MRIGTLYPFSSVIRSYISNRLPYRSRITCSPNRWIESAEIEVDAAAARSDAAPLVALLLRRAGRDVPGGEVPEARILPLKVVVPVLLGDLVGGLAAILFLLRDPDPAVVAQRLGHEGQLRLVVSGLRDAGGMDLREARVREEGAFLVGLPDRRDAAPHGVRRQIEDVHVSARSEHDGVARVDADLAGHEVADRDPLRLAVDHHQFEHLGAGEHLHRPQLDLSGDGGVGAQQELLPGLAAGVEGPGDLGAAEGAGVEVAGVVAGERHPLRDALVDDVVAHLGEPPDVRFAGPEVSALDRVVEEPVDAVAVVGVVLRGVDPALGGDAVGAPRAVLVAERLDVVPEFPQGGGGGGAGQAGPHHEDLVLALVRGVHQLHVEAVLVPRLFDGAGRCLSVEDHCVSSLIWPVCRRE